MPPAADATGLKVADEVWIVTALLHREQPWRPGFRPSEILTRAAQENLTGDFRPGVNVHISLHCIANRAPNPGRYRMLYTLPNGERRLFRRGDDYHPGREGGKIRPEKEDIPRRFHPLVDWYEQEYSPAAPHGPSLRGALKPRPARPVTDWARAQEVVEQAVAREFIAE